MLANLPWVALEQVALAEARSAVNQWKNLGVFAHALKNQQSSVDDLLSDLGL
ncbi:hypothetical protein WDW89_24830 [Deltaproteobacteria bacterium TL4]